MRRPLTAILILTSSTLCHGLHLDLRSNNNMRPVHRRTAIKQAVAVASFAAALPKIAHAAATVDLTVPKTKSVLVLGANGGTGRACVSALIQSRPCIATTRSGSFDLDGPESLSLLETAAADVTSLESLDTVIGNSKNLGAVIFAASASTKGGDAYQVDKQGVINAAKACIKHNIPRLVIVSSGSVTRPDSNVYQLLNLVGKGIMEAKFQGEDAVRDLYMDPDLIQNGIGYTILRPGGLTMDPPVGAGGLELNQGDSKSGRLSRLDVASLCVHCLDSPDTFDCTLECYETVTAKPIQGVGWSNILKQTNPTEFQSGYERHGETWSTLFQGLARDSGHNV